jgi:hypothetical protein
MQKVRSQNGGGDSSFLEQHVKMVAAGMHSSAAAAPAINLFSIGTT